MRYHVELVTRTSTITKNVAETGWGASPGTRGGHWHLDAAWGSGESHTIKFTAKVTSDILRVTMGGNVGPGFPGDFQFVFSDITTNKYRIVEGTTQVFPAVGENNFSVDDYFEIKISGSNVVTYYRNGSLLYTSAATPVFINKFSFDCNIRTASALIQEIQVDGTSLGSVDNSQVTDKKDIVVDDDTVKADIIIWEPHVDLLMDMFVHRYAVDIVADIFLSDSDYDEHDYHSFRDDPGGEDYDTNDPFFKEIVSDMAVKQLGKVGAEPGADMRLIYDATLGKTFGEIFTPMDLRLLLNPNLSSLYDLVVIKRLTKNLIIDMILNKTFDMSSEYDMKLINRLEISTILDTILKKLGIQITEELDMIIKKFAIEIDMPSDMTLKATILKDTLSDMLVKQIIEIMTQTDMRTVNRFEIQNQVDLLLLSVQNLAVITDMVVTSGPFSPEVEHEGIIRRTMENIGIIRKEQENIGIIRKEQEDSGTII